MSVFVYRQDRAEFGMVDPIIRRLKAKGLLTPDWKAADIILIPGDRREAMRFALDAFEAGKVIWHLGAGDYCEGDGYHYDGLYRGFISDIAMRSKGKLLALHEAHPPFIAVGPTMTDDLPTIPPHYTEPFDFLCYNATPFAEEEVPDAPKDALTFATLPGNDGEQVKLANLIERKGWTLLDDPEDQNRSCFLWHLKHARKVYGNSSAMQYEAPLWHPDEDIIQVGKRNKGRKIVRWDRERLGIPSENVVRLLQEEGGAICQ